MSDPFEELRLLKLRLARIEAAANGIDDDTKIWTTRELESREVWVANKGAIAKAYREGRIEESQPEVVQRVEFPPTGIDGLIQVAPGNIYRYDPPEKEATK